jgi:hypothetical protein
MGIIIVATLLIKKKSSLLFQVDGMDFYEISNRKVFFTLDKLVSFSSLFLNEIKNYETHFFHRNVTFGDLCFLSE